MSLFRPEVLQARAATGMGELQVRRSGWTTAGTIASLLLGAAIVAFLFLGRYGSRTAAIGQLEPTSGLLTIQPQVAGTLASVSVYEGQRVKQGEPLALVTADARDASGAILGDALERSLDERRTAAEAGGQAQQAQLDQEEAGLGHQITDLRVERARLADQLRTTQQRLDLATKTGERMAQMRAKGYLSELQIQQAETERLQLLAVLQALQRDDAAMARQFTQLQQQLDQLPVRRRGLVAARQGELAMLSQQGAEVSSRRARVLEAPASGLITARLAEPGQVVQATQSLLMLLPDGSKLEAHLLVPSRAIGFIKPGNTVRMRYPAFPYQRFGHQLGKVARVSRSAVGTASQTDGDTLYRVVVALDRQFVTAYGTRAPLLPGMRVEADILLEERPLIDWILEPLYALHGRIAS